MSQYAKLVGIRTWGSHSVLPRNAWVWCRFGNEAFRKRAEDVKPGDRVLERGTKISLSLGDIKNALMEDESTYRTAHRQLHVETENGEKPKLQVYLQNVLNPEGGAPKGSQKERIQTIQSRLKKISKAFGRRFPVDAEKLLRSESAIGSWLTGQTVLPSDLRVLRILRELDRTKFDELFGPPKELKPKGAPDAVQHPLAWAHGHWSTVHQTLRRWAEGHQLDPDEAETKEFELPEQEKKEGAKGVTDLHAARTAVFNRLIKHIAENIDSEHKFTRVKEVALLRPQEEREHTSKAPSISRGVVSANTQPIADLGVSETSARAIFREGIAMNNLISTLLQHERIPDVPLMGTPAGGWGEPIYDLLRLTENEQNKDKQVPLTVIVDGRIHILKLEPEHAQEVAQNLRRRIESGRIDEQNGLSIGTFKSLYDRRNECAKRDPVRDLYRDHGKRANPEILQLSFTKRGKQGLKDELKTIAQIGEKIAGYGVQPGSFSSPRHYNVRTAQALAAYEQKTTERMKQNGIKHFGFEPHITRPEIEKYLAGLGLSSQDTEKILDIYGRDNFVETE